MNCASNGLLNIRLTLFTILFVFSFVYLFLLSVSVYCNGSFIDEKVLIHPLYLLCVYITVKSK